MRLHVAADDRTGALEVAAALADRGVGGADGVPVAVWPATLTCDVWVTDLESRHLSADAAARRASRLDSNEPAAHKIDSTLRGNWAHELAARHMATRRPVLLVPALPAIGRVCVDGMVFVDGVPVHLHATDARREITGSRPADHLRSAGVGEVGEARTLDEVRAWTASPNGFLVADASTDVDVEAIVSEWVRSEAILLAGTSSVIAAAAGHSATVTERRVPQPVLVVCGSANSVARRQIEVAVGIGAVVAADRESAIAALRDGRHAVIASSAPFGRVEQTDAEGVAATLAADARHVVGAAPELGALVVIGGDTAAAVLGDSTVRVLGSVTAGSAWVESSQLVQPIITRAGGFGDEYDLAVLMWGTLPS